MTAHLNLPMLRAAAVEVVVQRFVIELRFEERCVAVIDREALRSWLEDPTQRVYPIDDVIWMGARSGHVRLAILHAGTWTLHPGTVRQLQAAL